MRADINTGLLQHAAALQQTLRPVDQPWSLGFRGEYQWTIHGKTQEFTEQKLRRKTPPPHATRLLSCQQRTARLHHHYHRVILVFLLMRFCLPVLVIVGHSVHITLRQLRVISPAQHRH
ncbi:hypothetical protein QQF64_017037 [Cirrhinus molitorella]|uniref:Uncharacterized protein n=1 Tax=Cirrhinus molitorella TaxID=172907 RepID=A0ABR3LKX5_9TELE